MPRCLISTSRSSFQSASDCDHGRVSSPAAWSAGGVKTNRIEHHYPERASRRASVTFLLQLTGRHVGAADDDGHVLAGRGLVGAGQQGRDPDGGGGLGGE